MAGEFGVTRDGAVHVMRITAQDGVVMREVGAQQHVVAAPQRDQPLLSGEPRDLWIGAGFVLLAFLAVTASMMVWRFGDAKTQRKKRNAELFQPAGEGAEITFDDEPPSQLSAKEARDRRKREKAERAAALKADKAAKAKKPSAPPPADEGANPDEAEVLIERSKPLEAPASPPPKKPERRSQPFAALFSRRKKADPQDSGSLDLGTDNSASDQLRLHPLASERRRPRDEERAEPELAEAAPERRPVRAEAEQAHLLAGRLEEERRQERVRLEAAEEMRRKAIDDARLAAERQQNEAEISRRAETARLQAEAEAREEARRRNYEREVEFERRKQLAAIEQRDRDSRRVENSNEALRRDLSLELERKIEALAARLPDRTMQAAQFTEPLPADPALLRAVDRIARDLAQQRTALDEAVGALSARIDEVGAATRDTDGLRQDMAGLKRALSERFSGPSAPIMQLEDILRNALPPDGYDLRVMLSNNRKADCLVRLPNPPGPIVIDARFPVEVFQKLHSDEAQDQGAAENEFRRTALRHIVDIAERLIIPGETADQALMFLPSESMHTEFLARFQDLVQDSYRARVWIVSPTTLMATLHTMRAVMREAPKPAAPEPDETQNVLAEVDALRRRVQGLETSFERARYDMRDPGPSHERPAAYAASPPAPVEAASIPTAPPITQAHFIAPVSVRAPVASAPNFLASAPIAPAPAPTTTTGYGYAPPPPHANGGAPPPMQAQHQQAQPMQAQSTQAQPSPPQPGAAPSTPERPTPAFLLPPVPPVR